MESVVEHSWIQISLCLRRCSKCGLYELREAGETIYLVPIARLDRSAYTSCSYSGKDLARDCTVPDA